MKNNLIINDFNEEELTHFIEDKSIFHEEINIGFLVPKDLITSLQEQKKQKSNKILLTQETPSIFDLLFSNSASSFYFEDLQCLEIDI